MRHLRRAVSVFSVGLLAVAIALIGLTAVTPIANAAPTSAAQPAADSPSPSPDATPAANPPGTADGDPSDWSGTRWLSLGLLIPVLFIGGVVLAKRRSSAARE